MRDINRLLSSTLVSFCAVYFAAIALKLIVFDLADELSERETDS